MGRGRKGVRVRHYASGSEAIQLDFTFRGVRCRETLPLPVTKPNLRYAENLSAEIRAKIARQTFRYSDYFPESPRARRFGHQVSAETVAEALEAWLDDARRTKKRSTWRSYEKSARGWLVPHLGYIRLVDLSPHHIRELVRCIDGKVKTISNILLPLRGTLKRALADEIIAKNPLDSVVIADLVSPDQRRSDYVVDPYTLAELQALLPALDRLFGANAVNLVQVHAFTGLRTSELFALRWPDIGRDSLRVERGIVQGREETTKTEGSERDVPLLPMAAQAIQRQRKETALQGEFVFRSLARAGWCRDYWKDYSAPLKRACQLAKVRYRNPYQFRHTFASQLLSGGENPLRVAKIMGHRDQQMVFRVYGRWIEEGQEFVSAWATLGTPTSRDESG